METKQGCCKPFWKKILKAAEKQHISISQSIQVRRIKHGWQFWRRMKELISDIHRGQSSVYWAAKTYIHQLCRDTECSPEDMPRMITDSDRCFEREREREKERERERDSYDDDDGRLPSSVWKCDPRINILYSSGYFWPTIQFVHRQDIHIWNSVLECLDPF